MTKKRMSGAPDPRVKRRRKAPKPFHIERTYKATGWILKSERSVEKIRMETGGLLPSGMVFGHKSDYDDIPKQQKHLRYVKVTCHVVIEEVPEPPEADEADEADDDCDS